MIQIAQDISSDVQVKKRKATWATSRLFDLCSRRNRQAKMCQLFFYNSLSPGMDFFYAETEIFVPDSGLAASPVFVYPFGHPVTHAPDGADGLPPDKV